ncbi:hypothetical protein D3C84_943490 [compost metagenome]
MLDLAAFQIGALLEDAADLGPHFHLAKARRAPGVLQDQWQRSGFGRLHHHLRSRRCTVRGIGGTGDACETGACGEKCKAEGKATSKRHKVSPYGAEGASEAG